MQTATEALAHFVAGLDGKGKAELDGLIAAELEKPWLPTPGPQLDAYLSLADLLLYGGAAGGGKTDLLCGLPLSEHERSVIFRRQSNDLDGYWDRLTQISPFNKKQDSVKKRLVTKDDRLIECGHLDTPGSEKSWQGRPHDFIGFDEGGQLVAYRVNFVLGWLRSTSGNRCRAIIASNPPIGGEGLWLIEWFAPWLDPLFPNPAKPGELRWGITIGDESEIRTVWVSGPGSYTADGQPWRSTELDGEEYIALSRTFIPSKLDDNPYLKDTGYRARINAMPEPLRSQLLHGDFLAGRTDHPYQVIPTAWIKAAQERWVANRDRPPKPMLHMGVDVAQGGGGGGTTVVSPLRGVRFDELTEVPGAQTPDPVPVVQLVLGLRRDDAGITIDLTGGWGGGVKSHLKTHNEIEAYAFVASVKSGARTKDQKLGFVNARSESWWAFRDGLDPSSGENIELPPDSKLAAQLAAPQWKLRGDLILVQPKEELMELLGTSTDKADAAIMAWFHRGKSIIRQKMKAQNRNEAAPVDDPLAGF